MKIVFFGTPDYVVPVLENLHKRFKSKTGESPIEAVVTQSPKPSGRKQILAYSPVDTWAHKKDIAKFFDPLDILKNNIHADLGIVASYGAIIPSEVIKSFPKGILNIHPSLLPAWRGSSPIQATIISQDQAGSSIMEIDEKLDHGKIVSQFKDEVLPDDTAGSLRDRLFKRSAEVLATLIPSYMTGKICPREQDHKKATIARTIKKEDAFIPLEYIKACLKGKTAKDKWEIKFMGDFSLKYSPVNIHNFIRAMQPWPGAWTKVKIKNEELRMKIINSHIEDSPNNDKFLVIDTIQLEGKNPVSWKQFEEVYNI